MTGSEARGRSTSERPTGTVTFLFSDIEGSTARWDRDRTAMQQAVRVHDQLMRTAIESVGGHVFKTIGDAFCAAFVTPEAAVTAAVAAQQALENADFAAVGGLRVRMAINTGTADERDGDYFGPTVNRVARLLALGHGGQVLLSGIAGSLVGENLPPDATLAKLGEFALKDLDRAEQVFQLVAPGLRREFPPLRSRLRENLWVVPSALRTHYFTGREELLASLNQRLADRRRASLSGLGGVGKTQLALEYATRHRYEYDDGVFWVNAETLGSLTNSFAQITSVLNLTPATSNDQEQMFRAALEWFAAHDRWLIIFDNVESADDVRRFVPDTKEGHLLITSRESVFQELGVARGLEVRDLAADEAVQFLHKRTGRESGENAEEDLFGHRAGGGAWQPSARPRASCGLHHRNRRHIHRVFERLPQAAHAVAGKSTSCPVTRQRGRHVGGELRGDREASPASAGVLRLSALVAPDTIPFELFLKGAQRLGGPIAAAIPDEDDILSMRELLRPLSHYSLVRTDEAVQTFSLHRLVQEIVRAALGDDGCRAYAANAIELLNAAFPEVAFAVWPQCDRLIPHVAAIAKWIDEYEIRLEAAGRLLTVAGRFLFDRGRYGEAEPIIARALSIRERLLGTDHPDFAATLNVMAAVNLLQGRHAKAQSCHERALAIRERVLGPDHEDVAASLNNLANVHFHCGRYAQAAPLYKRALEIFERADGPQYPGLANALNNLAETNNEMGRYAEALPLHERALALRERSLGPDHPHVALSLRNLGKSYWAQGKYEEASKFHERALEIRERALGPNHSDVAESLRNVALARMQQGRTAEALTLYERALAIQERCFGPNHPDYAESLADIADVQREEGRSAEAEQLYGRALTMLQSAYGDHHPAVARVLHALADVAAMQGKADAAEALFRRGLNAVEGACGPDHPGLADLLIGLATLLEHQGRAAEATSFLERALVIDERVFAPDHPELIALRNRVNR